MSTPSHDPDLRPYSRLLHGGLGPDPATGAILTPVYQSTTFVQDGIGGAPPFTYSRTGNPTVAALERNLGAIEQAPPAVCFRTGMAAISALMLGLCRAGDEVVVSDVVYGGVVRLLRRILADFGLRPRFVDTSSLESLERVLTDRTRLVLIETPANPTLKLTDVAAVADAVHAAGSLLAVDNTFLTAELQRPLDLGADVAVYSTTKYVEGHNATLGGAVLSRDEELLERVRFTCGTLGCGQAPWEAWLTLHGLRTLPLRLRRHCDNALQVATWLREHPDVERVSYPWLPEFPQHDLARRQQAAGGGMLTFEVRGGARAGRELMESLRLCSLAENLGAVESLVTHPASMTHAALEAGEREDLGIGDGLVRLSVGLEDPEDVIADLDRGLAVAAGRVRPGSGR